MTQTTETTEKKRYLRIRPDGYEAVVFRDSQAAATALKRWMEELADESDTATVSTVELTRDEYLEWNLQYIESRFHSITLRSLS